MKLVEIIILAGTQCASPITPGHLASDVSKVPCAVVIERDTETRSISVQPPELANHPKVRLALAKPVAAPPMAATIAPSAAPGPQIAPTASAPQAMATVPPVVGAEVGTAQAPQPGAAARVEEQQIAALPEDNSALEANPPQVPPVPVLEEPQPEAEAPVEEPPPAAEAQPEPSTQAAEKPKAKTVAPKKVVKKKSAARVAGLAAKPRSARGANQCISPARPVWYTNKSGQKKYRCAKPGAKLSLY